jgi:hypothetical protein
MSTRQRLTILFGAIAIACGALAQPARADQWPTVDCESDSGGSGVWCDQSNYWTCLDIGGADAFCSYIASQCNFNGGYAISGCYPVDCDGVESLGANCILY